MTKYRKFNAWVYNSYVDRSIPSVAGSFAIELGEFLRESDVEDFFFDEVRSMKWSALLVGKFEERGYFVPKYFGLIALQCYAALLMETDRRVSERAYQDRFCELVGFTSTGRLQQRFAEEVGGRSFQELLWETATEHFAEMGCIVPIPDSHEGAGRYVQYPISQVVLNREDLKEYIPMFEAMREMGGLFGFEDFHRFYRTQKARYFSQMLRKRNKRTDLNETERKIKLKQIFDFYYCDWEEAYVVEKKMKTKEDPLNGSIALVLNNVCRFYDYQQKEVSPSERSTRKYLFFKKSEYENEYDLCPSLEFGEEFLLCCSLGSVCPKKGDELVAYDKFYRVFRLTFEKGDDLSYMRLFLFQPFPVVLSGLKVNRLGHFLHGFGPSFLINDDVTSFKVRNEGGQVIADISSALPPGTYKIRVPSFPEHQFKVVDLTGINETIDDDGYGWGFGLGGRSQTGHRINGLLVIFDTSTVIQSPMQKWKLAQVGVTLPKINDTRRRILKYERNGY